MKVLEAGSPLRRRALYHGFEDDFDHLVTADRWTTTVADSGSVTVSAGAGGVVDIAPSDGTVADNDEAYIETAELFKIADGKPLGVEFRAKFTEANTDDANLFVGVLDAIGANTLVDNGAGMKTSFSGAAFYKVDGGTKWNVIYSDGSTQTTVELTDANIEKYYKDPSPTPGGGTWVRLGIEITPVSSTAVDISFFYDGKLIYKMKDKTYANATEMSVGAGVKNGDTNEETLSLDYVVVEQVR